MEDRHMSTNHPLGLISSRNPDDLPAFCRTLVEQFQTAGAPA
jgi:protease I